jgi:hypothetical protein
MSEDISRAQHLSDLDLLARLKALAQREREATVALIAHLAVLDERRLYLGEGHPSLFAYCTEEQHLAEHAAYNQIEAARAGRKFPVILGMLAEGAVTLATVRLLAPHLTPANHADLLAAARCKSKREVAELVAKLSPKPSVPSTVRMLPTPNREPHRWRSEGQRGQRLPHQRARPWLSHSGYGGIGCSSLRPPRPATSCAWPRISSAIRSPMATSGRSSIAR